MSVASRPSPLEKPLPNEAVAGSVAVLPWRDFFSLDVRSLAVFRIGLALCLIGDWLDRLPDLRAHYTDAGIVPRDAVVGIMPISVHFFSGDLWLQVLLLGLALLTALALLVGWRTPLATLLSWLLLISVHARNFDVLQGGDQLLRLLLFWGLFLPLGACFSLDAYRARDRSPSTPRVLSLGSLALILQLCQVYWFAGAWKWAPEWRSEGTAIYQTLQIDYFTSHLGQLLAQWPEACRLLTYSTVYLEVLGPTLLFVPFYPALLRLLVIAAFLLFHAGLAMTLELGNFPWVCGVTWLALLPTPFWDRIAAQVRAGELAWLVDPARYGRLAKRLLAWLPGGAQPEAVPAWAPPSGMVSQTILLFCIFYIALWNVRTINHERNAWALPGPMHYLGEVLGIDQGWGLFAPAPGKDHGWFLVVGTQKNGQTVDAFWGGPVRTSKPDVPSEAYANGRWRKLIMNLPHRYQTNSPLLFNFCRYVFDEWNRTHEGDEQLASVQVIWLRELTVLPGEDKPPPTPVVFPAYPPAPSPAAEKPRS